MKLPRSFKVRRRLRRRIGAWLNHSRPSVADREPLAPAELRRILVVRINPRLGNLVLISPFLKSLHRAYPQASVDLLVGHPSQQALYRGFAGLDQVFCLTRHDLKWPGKLWKLRKVLQERAYDLAIDPVLNSTSNRLALLLASSRYRMGFQTEHQWVSLSHGVTPMLELQHEAVRPLQLLEDGLKVQKRQETVLDLCLTPRERQSGKLQLEQLTAGPRTGRLQIGFFAGARGQKELPLQFWEELIRSLLALPWQQHPPGIIQLLPPGESSQNLPEVWWLMEKDPRKLAAVLSHLDLFICGDTGPMHLACSAGVPTLGLFQASNPEQYAPLSLGSQVLDLRHETPHQFHPTALRALRERLKSHLVDSEAQSLTSGAS